MCKLIKNETICKLQLYKIAWGSQDILAIVMQLTFW